MKFNRIALVATALFGFASAANAQDAETVSFTGPWVAALAGLDDVTVGIDDGDTEHQTGLIYGGAAGFDFELGGFVAGVEGEYAESKNDASASDVFDAGDRLTLGVGRDLYVGGRIGARVGRQTLVYGKAGYINTNIDGRYDDGLGNDDSVTTGSEDIDGFRLGLGVEWASEQGWFVKGEGRYTEYTGIDGEDLDGVDAHRVGGVLSVGYRF